MSRLVAKILLAILLIPLSIVLYAVEIFAWEQLGFHGHRHERYMFSVSGLGLWVFFAVYWLLLWRGSIRWNPRRIAWTIGLVGLAGAAGALLGLALELMAESDGFGWFIASILSPLLWLVGTIFVWRETREERAARLANSARDNVVCPTCGYNLTGLKEARCPECGTQFTLDELLAHQREGQLAE